MQRNDCKGEFHETIKKTNYKHMKNYSRILVTVALAIISFLSQAQDNGGVAIGKGNVAAHSSAILELVSSDKGLLIPRMTTEQRNAIKLPADGLIVFDTTTSSMYVFRNNIWNYVPAGDIASGNVLPATPTSPFFYNTTEKMLYTSLAGKWTSVGARRQLLDLTGNIHKNYRRGGNREQYGQFVEIYPGTYFIR